MRIEYLLIILFILLIINKNCKNCEGFETKKKKKNKSKGNKGDNNLKDEETKLDTEETKLDTEENKDNSPDVIVNTFNTLKGKIITFMEKWQEIRGLHSEYDQKLIDTTIPFKMKLASQKRFENIEKTRSDFEQTKINLMGIFSQRRTLEDLNYRRTKNDSWEFYHVRNDKIEFLDSKDTEKFRMTSKHIDLWLEFMDKVWIPFFREELINFQNHKNDSIRGVGQMSKENAEVLKSQGITQIATTPEVDKNVNMDNVSPNEEVVGGTSNYGDFKSKKNVIKMNNDEYIKGGNMTMKDIGSGGPKPLKQVDPNFSYYGRTYMPPQTWSVPQKRPPVCLGNKDKVAEYPTIGYPVESLSWEPELTEKYNMEQVDKGVYIQDGQPKYPKFESGYYNMHKSENVIKNM